MESLETLARDPAAPPSRFPYGRRDGGRPTLDGRLRPALRLLLESCEYARSLGRPAWDFAVEISSLLELGLTRSDCRWLVARGLATHAVEVTLADHDRRVFTACRNLAFPDSTCFVLTEEGIRDARLAGRFVELGSPVRDLPLSHVGDGVNLRELDVPSHPVWDRSRQELRVGARIVKRFKVPAANQETILAAFEEEQWPPRIDDPLPLKVELDAKRRLHDTINSLNRNQRCQVLRFFGDGSGQGIRWEFLEPATPRAGAGEG